MKTIAIIGSHGMLGLDLVRFLSRDFKVTGITRTNYRDYKGEWFDVVINANGNSRRFWANKYPLDDFQASTGSVYKTVFDFKYSLYIYISSSDVYNHHANPFLTRENTSIDPHALSFYGFHKFLSEIIVQKHVKQYIILRSSMILGNKLKKGPFYDILHGNELFIAKNSRLQLITTEAVAVIITHLLEQGIKNEIYNIGGSGALSFQGIEKYFLLPVVFSKQGEKQEYEMNIKKILKLIKVKTSEKYLRDFLEHFEP